MGRDPGPTARSKLMITGGPWINSEGCKTEQNVMNGRRVLVWKREVDVGGRREIEGDGVRVTRMLLVYIHIIVQGLKENHR